MSLDGKNSSTMVGGEGEENTKTEEEEQQRQDLEEGEGSGQAAAAAMHIQRRYRGYRVRRKVADAAVMANISWWNAVDAVILLQNTEHYYAYKKNSCNASSNWLRLQKKAAKVQFSFFSHQGRKKMPVYLSLCLLRLKSFLLQSFVCCPLFFLL
jgi:hypothetical protein